MITAVWSQRFALGLLWGPPWELLLETHCILRAVIPVECLRILEPLLAVQAVSLGVLTVQGAGKSQAAPHTGREV